MKCRFYADALWRIGFWGTGIGIMVVLAVILCLLVFRGGGELSWEFLTASPKGMFLGSEGGIWPAIAGTISLLAIAVFSAAIPALLTAIYVVEYGQESALSRAIYFIIQSMIGIPSILIGLFGYAFFVVYFKFGISLLAGGFTLAVMVLPTLVILMCDALRSVDAEYRLLGETLGLSRRYMLQRIILPIASPHLLSAILLAMGYAAGATAPIMVTAAVVMARGSISLANPVMALPFHLYVLFSQHISIERAYATALVLVLLLLLLNMLSLYLRSFYGREWQSDD